MLSVCFLFVLVVQEDLYSIEASRVRIIPQESVPSPGAGRHMVVNTPGCFPKPPGWLAEKESGPSPGEGHGVPPSVPNPPGWLKQKESGPSPGEGHGVPLCFQTHPVGSHKRNQDQVPRARATKCQYSTWLLVGIATKDIRTKSPRQGP
ncbi:hypothetical protein Tco_0377392 [Tanacetum coccineum]